MTSMPQPFMYWHGTDVGCHADLWAPPSARLYVFDMPIGFDPFMPMWALPPRKRPTKPIVIAHPAAWAARGAHMLAQAYRPEGLR